MHGSKRIASVEEYDKSASAWNREPERVLNRCTEMMEAVEVMKGSWTMSKVTRPRRLRSP